MIQSQIVLHRLEVVMRRAGWAAHSRRPLAGPTRSVRAGTSTSNVMPARCVSQWVCRTKYRGTRVVVQKFSRAQVRPITPVDAKRMTDGGIKVITGGNPDEPRPRLAKVASGLLGEFHVREQRRAEIVGVIRVERRCRSGRLCHAKCSGK